MYLPVIDLDRAYVIVYHMNKKNCVTYSGEKITVYAKFHKALLPWRCGYDDFRQMLHKLTYYFM